MSTTRFRSLRFIFGILGAAFVALFATAWIGGGLLIAPAHRSVGPPPSDLPVVSATLQSDSGAELSAWYIPLESSRATVVLLHSIRADRRSMLGRARLFREAGYAVVMIDMQAHGESSGARITMGFLERHDARAAIAYARKLNPNHRIAVVGTSLGGAAVSLASPLGVDAVVLESVYPTVQEAVENRLSMRLGPLGARLAPLLLFQLPLRLGIRPQDLRPIDAVGRLSCPVLIVAGDKDRHTTLSETRRMFAAAAEPKRLIVFKGAAHVDLLAFDPKLYEKEVLPFLEAYLR